MWLQLDYQNQAKQCYLPKLSEQVQGEKKMREIDWALVALILFLLSIFGGGAYIVVDILTEEANFKNCVEELSDCSDIYFCEMDYPENNRWSLRYCQGPHPKRKWTYPSPPLVFSGPIKR